MRPTERLEVLASSSPWQVSKDYEKKLSDAGIRVLLDDDMASALLVQAQRLHKSGMSGNQFLLLIVGYL